MAAHTCRTPLVVSVRSSGATTLISSGEYSLPRTAATCRCVCRWSRRSSLSSGAFRRSSRAWSASTRWPALFAPPPSAPGAPHGRTLPRDMSTPSVCAARKARPVLAQVGWCMVSRASCRVLLLHRPAATRSSTWRTASVRSPPTPILNSTGRQSLAWQRAAVHVFACRGRGAPPSPDSLTPAAAVATSQMTTSAPRCRSSTCTWPWSSASA